MLHASAEPTAAPRIGPRQPQARDAKTPQDGFSSLIDNNAPAPRESEPAPRAPALQKAREEDDRTPHKTDRASPSDDTPAPETASAGKTDADALKTRENPDKPATEPFPQPIADMSALDPAMAPPEPAKGAQTLPAVPLAVVLPAPAVVSRAPTPLAIAAAAIAAAAKTSKVPTGTNITEQAGPDVTAAVAKTAPTPSVTVAKAALEAGAATVETGFSAASGAEPAAVATADAPVPATAKPAPKMDASTADAKPKDADIPDAAPTPTPAPHAQPADHRAATAPASPDVTPAGPQPAAPQPASHTVNAPSPTVQLTATVATATPVPLNGLAVELAARTQSGATRFQIRLDPAELGRIDVRIDIDKQGQVTSHLTVEKPETLAMLRQDSPQLQRALTDAGLKTSENGLQFTLGDQSQPRQQADSGERQAQRFIIRDDETVAPAAPVRGYGRMFAASSGIDISV